MYSFKLIKLIEYIRYNYMFNITEIINGGCATKLASSKLIAYNIKMSTNNMTKSKWPEYTCFRICNVDAQIIDWICN